MSDDLLIRGATLYDGSGVALWTTDLEPEPLTPPSR